MHWLSIAKKYLYLHLFFVLLEVLKCPENFDHYFFTAALKIGQHSFVFDLSYLV